MSTFADSHSLPKYEQRKAAAKKSYRSMKRWMKADEMVTEIYVDLCNGLTKSDIVEKVTQGLYENQSKPLSVRSASDYLDAAYRRMQYDFESQAEELRAELYAKLMTIYADSIKANDRYNALQTIDRIMKLTGVAQDKPTNNVLVNATKEGITINFGFNKEEKEDDSEL